MKASSDAYIGSDGSQPEKVIENIDNEIVRNRPGLVRFQLPEFLFGVPKPGVGSNCKWMDVPVNCGQRGLPYAHHSLYGNNGDGMFTDVSKEAGIGKAAPGYSLTVGATDLDEDGWPDIYVASDTTPSLLFRNRGDGTYEGIGLISVTALSEDGVEQSGMGVAVGETTLSGRLDIFKTHFRGDPLEVTLQLEMRESESIAVR